MKKEQGSYRNVSENPCNMCMPLGGIIAFKGVEGAMALVHGSQGCATYMRRTIAEHYNEPVDVASSSLNEKGTVYGGEENLHKGLDNVLKVYQPQLVGIMTTCLAETIGEDIDRMALEYLQHSQREGFPVVTVPTPGYGGTHTDGYFLTLKRIVAKLVQKTQPHSRINVIIPHISPADIRELKRILDLKGIQYTLLPDYSDTLDGPYSHSYPRITAGGTPLKDIVAMGGAKATIEFATTVEEAYSPGSFLEKEYAVPLFRLPLPIGIKNTDAFLETLTRITGKSSPKLLVEERGRLLDGMIDSHKHNFQGRAVIFGEPEQVLALTDIARENGIVPLVLATGSRSKKFKELLGEALKPGQKNYVVLEDTDFSQIREKCREQGINVALGNSDGKYLTEKEGIPLVRVGFPIHDRMGAQRLLSLGYQGSLTLLDRITNTLLENKYNNYRADMYHKYYNRHGDTPD